MFFSSVALPKIYSLSSFAGTQRAGGFDQEFLVNRAKGNQNLYPFPDGVAI
eukprot:UN12575